MRQRQEIQELLRPRGVSAPLLIKRQLEHFPGGQIPPPREKFVDSFSHSGEVGFRQYSRLRPSLGFCESRSEGVELLRRASRVSSALRAQRTDNVFHFDRFLRQRTERPFPGSVRDVPVGCDETVEAASIAQLGLDCVMGEIVEREKCGALIVLSLPCRRPVGADAADNSAAVFSLGELNFQINEIKREISQFVIPSRPRTCVRALNSPESQTA